MPQVKVEKVFDGAFWFRIHSHSFRLYFMEAKMLYEALQPFFSVDKDSTEEQSG